METTSYQNFIRSYRDAQAKLATHRSLMEQRAPLQPGDIYAVRRCGIPAWAGIIEKKGDLWTAVWVDGLIVVGPYDRRVGGNRIARASRPFAIHETDLARRVDFLDEWDLGRVQEALQARRAGDEELTPSQEAGLCDPELIDWKQNLEREIHRLHFSV